MQRLTLNNLDGMTGLAGLADRTGVDIKPTLLRVLTDLYIQKATHTPDEDDQFTELALRLIDAVDHATREIVANRLRLHTGAPAAVLDRLAELAPHIAENRADGGRADPSVETSLDDDLGLFEHTFGPSDRTGFKHGVRLNGAIPLPVDYIAQREAFFSASPEERSLILFSLEHVADQSAPAPIQTNIIRYLEQSALAGRAQEFTTLLQQGLGVSRALTRRIVMDPLGEAFVVSAKALAMPTGVFQRILMSLNPDVSHSVNRVFELSDLFLELPASSALHLVAIWRAADRMEVRTLVHHRSHREDSPGSVRRATTTGYRRSTEQPSMPDLLRREGLRG